MTRTLNIHLNIGQNLTINTPSILMTLGRVPWASLPTKGSQHLQAAEIRLPLNLYSNVTADSTVVTYRVCSRRCRSIFIELAVVSSSSNH